MISCIIVDDEPLARETLEVYVDKIPALKLLGSFEDPFEAMDLLGKEKVDLVFSDIQMPDISGISLLKSLANPPLFIFVTGNPEHAAQSFELDVLDYIVKPYDFDRFLKSVNKAQAVLDFRKSPAVNKAFLLIKDRSLNVIVRYDEIYYVEGNKDYVNIVTSEKTHSVSKTMSYMESVLPNDRFLRVHKSYIINLAFAKAVTAVVIKMKGNIKDIPIGMQYREDLYRNLGIN